jgi:putrescine aminotransferase
MPAAFLHPYAKPTRESFIRIERGEGALVWDENGRELVDGMASLWYNAIGHGREEMAEAIAAQVRTLGAYSTFDPFTNEPAEALAEELRQIAPTPNARVFFTSSGSESIDTVMKLARMAHVQAGQPQRKLIISRTRGYHGVAYGGTSALGIAAYKENFGPFVDEVIQVPPDDIEAVATLMSQRGNEVAAIMTEPVQGAGGVFEPIDGYLQSLRKLCDQHGAYLVSPDFATFAKGVTSGYIPLGGVFVGTAPTAALETNPDFILFHGFTYSGHPTACAAGLKNLEIIRREGLVERAKHIEDRLGGGLHALASDGVVESVRGVGGMWALAVRPDQDAKAMRDHMLDTSGVIVRALADGLVMCPPLVIRDEHMDQLVDAVAAAAA